MSRRVLIVGAEGKMGRLAVETIESAPDFAVAGTVTRGDDLEATIDRAAPEIWIDMTSPEVGADHLDRALERGIHPVFGTTGIAADRLAAAVEVAIEKQLGGVIAPNFSLGACLMMELAETVAAHLPEVEILEAHHPQKKDAPSGTSLRTRARIAEARERSDAEIPIHSLRLPGFIASQEVIFGGVGERLSIRHDTLDRQCFAAGILLACRRVTELSSLVLELGALLFERSIEGTAR